MDKSPDAFRTISEVAADLDLPQHVLRFWETRFVQIRPLKRGGGRRYYRPDDVELLKGIRHLLYGEGYTIRGVQRILKEQGVRFVMNVWHDGAPQPPPAAARFDEAPAAAEPAWEDDGPDDAAAQPPDDAYSPYAPRHLAAAPSPRPAEAPDFAVPMVRPGGAPVAPPPGEPTLETPLASGDAAGVSAMAHRFAPRFAEPVAGEPLRPMPRPAVDPRAAAAEEVEPMAPRAFDDDVTGDAAGGRPVRLPAGIRPPEAVEPQLSGIGQFLDRLRPAPREGEAGPAGSQTLSRDEIRRLQSTLFELLECKRLLDQVR